MVNEIQGVLDSCAVEGDQAVVNGVGATSEPGAITPSNAESSEALDIKAMLRRYRSRLINVSRRNRELYFKSTSLSFSLSEPLVPWFTEGESGEAEMTRQSPTQKSLSSAKFAPITIAGGSADATLASDQLSLRDLFDLNFAQKLGDGQLKDDYTKCEKKLERIRLADSRYAKEFGLTGAWMLGPFLCWRSAFEHAKSDLLVSPLFRFPIDLVKNKQRGWELILEQGDLAWNPSLRHALSLCWDVQLPLLSEGDGFEVAITKLQQVLLKSNKSLSIAERVLLPKLLAERQSIKDENGEVIGYEAIDLEKALSKEDLELYKNVTAHEFLIIDCFWVSHINASRMVLVDDYNRMIDSDEDHSLISSLLAGRGLEDDILVERSPEKALVESCPVVSIDGSQQEAVFAARAARGLVIQGPPGTGKSQTIVNIIADSILRNARVLFVSEKRAALDVVYNRLEKAGIGSLAAILHSSDLDRSVFYQSFAEVLKAHLSLPRSAHDGLEKATTELINKAEEIQRYREVLQAKHASGFTVSEICALVAAYGYQGGERPLCVSFPSIDKKAFAVIVSDLPKIEKAIRALPVGSESWLGKRPELVGTPAFEVEFKKFAEDLFATIDRALLAYNDYEVECQRLGGAWSPDRVMALVNRIDTVSIQRCLLLSSDLQERVGVLSALLTTDSELLAALNSAQSGIRSSRAVFQSFKPETRLDEVRALASFFEVKHGFFAFLNSTYCTMKKRGKAILLDPTKATEGVVYRDFIEANVALTAVRELLNKLVLPSPDDADYQGWLLSIENLTLLANCISEVVALDDNGKTLNGFDFPRLRDALQLIDTLRTKASLADAESIKVQSVAEGYRQWFTNPRQQDYRSTEELEAVRKLLHKRIDSVGSLGHVDGVQVALDRLASAIGVGSLSMVCDELIASGFQNWVTKIGSELGSQWFDEARVGFSDLRAYNREIFDDLLRQFAQAEQAQRVEGQKAVLANAASRCAAIMKTDGVALLKREAEKKRRLLTPREIMEKGALDEMLSIKPVWLMSPLSISQVLPFAPGLFDVVIFDEASQVTVEDALPSLYRAKRAILVGDRQQMPPTNFFNGVSSDDDEEDEGIDSILDLAQRVFPEVTLRWHYRSKSHELIAFSNAAFYKNSLVVPPSVPKNEGSAIEFVRVVNASFTMTAGNRVEAEIVIDRLREILESKRHKSVGLIAFGVSQQKVLEDVLEERVAADAEFASLVEEAQNLTIDGADCGLFIKNLESVQGDERDCILLSVGYAPAKLGGVLRQHFGPLSQAGGGRRLNVAVTRALSKVVVFCSFDPEQIQTIGRSSNNVDTELFARYLRYAKAVSLSDTQAVNYALGTPKILEGEHGLTSFAEQVKASYESKGTRCFTVSSGGGYFFDFAYQQYGNGTSEAVAVECDGVSLQASSFCRDRDLLRLQLLESRGWRVRRVWPTEFVLGLDPDSVSEDAPVTP